MTAQLIDGKKIADALIEDLRGRVASRVAAGRLAPGLAVILVGENPASKVYVRNKQRACERAGFRSWLHAMPASTGETELLAQIDALNADPNVHGILVQMPLPAGIRERAVTGRIDPRKDADGFHPYNMGLLARGEAGPRPCTPKGVMTLLEKCGIETSGRRALVLGRSQIVGRPMALELIKADATVTVCHSRTLDLPAEIGRADILIAAIGKPRFVPGAWVKPGAVVIDVGINRLPDGGLCGDVDFESARARAGWITPVPGGVGPMTVASLLENTLLAAEAQDEA
jgi:methylenetetrahydrofolate dehydrogenase (NADP+)/methenyltetrahydrofolate cyclohydrolase